MEEKMIKEMTVYFASIAKSVCLEVLKSEMPKILDELSVPGNNLSDLIDYGKATQLLGITKATLHNYINTGKLTKHYVVEGGKPFLSLKEIESIMQKKRRVNPRLTIGKFQQDSWNVA